ncbi:MAG: solute carrier family 26 protein [Gammaproteobacteria bacterium]|nr:solute carrier family 26 protein [Gammaproteobacteria bacterium]
MNVKSVIKVFFSSLALTLVPFRSWIGELKDPAVLKADAIAGATVALVLIPQSMAYAQLAGLPVYYGLYASFLPGIVAAIFGSSRQLSTGPVAVVSLLTASALEPIAGSDPEAYLAYAIILALFVGVFQVSLGLFKLGVLVNFLSHPVVIGFTNAAAIIIATSQIDKLFGVSVEKAAYHYETVWRVLIAVFTHVHWPTLGMAVLSLAILFLLRYYLPKWPNVLIAVAVTTLISWFSGFRDSGGAVVGSIPVGLPGLQIPSAEWSEVISLIGTAVAIGLIGFMEAISIAKAMAARSQQKLDPNQELVGQGLSNITSGLFQGYAVSGSFSRSAVNINAGAVTGFSSIVTGMVVGITLLWLTPLLYHLPQATLAAVIVMAVVNLIRIEPFLYAWKVQKHDGIVAMVTFSLTLVLAPHLENGIITGVLLSLGLFLHRTMRPRIAMLSRHKDTTLRDARIHNLQTCPHISVVRFDMSLYFANTGYFEDTILELVASKPELRYIIIDAESVNHLDATGEEMLHSLARALDEAGVEFLFARAKLQVVAVMIRTGFMETLGQDHFFRTRTDALEYAWERTYCEHQGCTDNCYLSKNHKFEQTESDIEQDDATAVRQ